MAKSNTDCNLLFGILALHNGFISRDALIRAMSTWVTEKPTPLGEILVRHGDLTPDLHFMMEALVQAHLNQHGGDPEESLGALSATALARVLLSEFADQDIQTSLSSSPRAASFAATHGDDHHRGGAAADDVAGSVGRRFRILRPHAEGGLGAVYVARDEELNREVALKQIKERYCTDPESRSRFVAEAEITGNLEHPGVVPVYSLGRDERGQPFYAMRFIRGDDLRQAIDRFHAAAAPGRDPGERALELLRLLGRFGDVCQAVAYAHSRGVIHRDLKPANILLGPYGETLVVDWGLAKALGRDEQASAAHPEEVTLRPASGSDGAMTLPGAPQGTPAYMSPEQAGGELARIGPASDVYSLGATLYHLLTGRPPFLGGDAAEVLRRVRTGEFPPPRSAKPQVPRPLEAVCLKAMAVKPKDRYATPLALAEEIEHWLADEPVAAHRAGIRERVQRWMRRHRSWAQAAAASLVVVAVVAVIATFLVDRARRSERRALDRAVEALIQEQAANTEMLRQRDLARENLDHAQANLRRATQAESSAVRFGMGLAEKLVHSRMNDQALDLYRKEVLPRLQELIRDNPRTAAYSLALAQGYHFIGRVCGDTGRNDEAIRHDRRAIELYEAWGVDHSGERIDRQLLANTYNNLAVSLKNVPGTDDEASRAMAQAVDQWRQIVADSPGNAEMRGFLANSLSNLADLERQRRRLDTSRRLAAEALTLQKATVQELPGIKDFQGYLYNNYYHLVKALNGLGRHVEAAGMASDLAQFQPFHPEGFYHAACCLALTSAAAADDRGLPASQRGQLAEVTASQAVVLLGRARDLGWFTIPGMLDHARSDPDLQVLRIRRDFQSLMSDAVFPADPFASHQPSGTQIAMPVAASNPPDSGAADPPIQTRVLPR